MSVSNEDLEVLKGIVVNDLRAMVQEHGWRYVVHFIRDMAEELVRLRKSGT